MKWKIKRLLWEIWINRICRSFFIPNKLKFYLYRFGGLHTLTPNIRSGCTFNGWRVSIGEGSFINHNVYINCFSKVKIGKNVYIAFDVLIMNASHEIGKSRKRAGKLKLQPVEIGDGSWIGARATILPGVKIGKGCIVAAGALVNKDCEPNGVYAGVPAKRIKDLD